MACLDYHTLNHKGESSTCSVRKIETNKKREKKAETGEFSPKNVLKTYSNMTVLQYKTSYLFLAQNKQQQVGNK